MVAFKIFVMSLFLFFNCLAYSVTPTLSMTPDNSPNVTCTTIKERFFLCKYPNIKWMITGAVIGAATVVTTSLVVFIYFYKKKHWTFLRVSFERIHRRPLPGGSVPVAICQPMDHQFNHEVMSGEARASPLDRAPLPGSTTDLGSGSGFVSLDVDLLRGATICAVIASSSPNHGLISSHLHKLGNVLQALGLLCVINDDSPSYMSSIVRQYSPIMALQQEIIRRLSQFSASDPRITDLIKDLQRRLARLSDLLERLKLDPSLENPENLQLIQSTLLEAKQYISYP